MAIIKNMIRNGKLTSLYERCYQYNEFCRFEANEAERKYVFFMVSRYAR
ncbi:MAG: hypothetical protein J1E34_05840 [Oscillospiraceae bacterium]|nr:hypothetical protein [Oscillospiraceae bacterium]